MRNLVSTVLRVFGRRQPLATSEEQRLVPDAYLDAGRRLLPSHESLVLEGSHCWTCRHDMNYLNTWGCERHIKYDRPCAYEAAYVESELTAADMEAGKKWIGGWFRLTESTPRQDHKPMAIKSATQFPGVAKLPPSTN